MNDEYNDADGLLWIRIHRQPHKKKKASRADGISAGDWRTVVRADASLRLIDHVDGVNPKTGESMRIPVEDHAVWLAHPSGIQYRFEYRKGAIIISSADRCVLEKARSIATLLGAHVTVTVD